MELFVQLSNIIDRESIGQRNEVLYYLFKFTIDRETKLLLTMLIFCWYSAGYRVLAAADDDGGLLVILNMQTTHNDALMV